MIQFCDVTFGYDNKVIFEHLTCTFPQPGNIALMGPSGDGKTTLLRLICGLEKPWSGTIQGTEGLKISYLFQENRLLPWCSALENLSLVCQREQAERMLDLLGIDSPDKLPSAFSGGQQRRIALARALCFGGDLLIMDEPFKGLDEKTRLVCIRQIWKSGMPVIFTTHDEQEPEMLDARIFRTEQMKQRD